jgi:pimeloyl-ACP methyl ester carboxylesterase
VPPGWRVLEPPPFRLAGGRLDAYRDWARTELRAERRPVAVGGHSMGGALAILAALDEPSAVERLVLVSPAGLPLEKPMRGSLADLALQLARGRYPCRVAVRGTAAALRAPRSAFRVADAVRRLDLRPELARAAALGIPTTVVGCRSDTLTTVAHCRRLAHLLGATYRELPLAGGHMWMLGRADLLSRTLAG